MAFFGYDLNASGALGVRLLGASFIVLALWLGLGRETEEDLSRRAVCSAVLVGDLLGAVVITYGLLTGVGNALAWTAVLLYLVLAVLFGYYLVTQPEGKFAI
jgi:hypothetical protein